MIRDVKLLCWIKYSLKDKYSSIRMEEKKYSWKVIKNGKSLKNYEKKGEYELFVRWE